MIVGIGCDIVKISRMSKIVPVFKQSMRQHILSPVEQQELNAQDLNDDKISRFLAKRFAAKEAFSKALAPVLSTVFICETLRFVTTNSAVLI